MEDPTYEEWCPYPNCGLFFKDLVSLVLHKMLIHHPEASNLAKATMVCAMISVHKNRLREGWARTASQAVSLPYCPVEVGIFKFRRETGRKMTTTRAMEEKYALPKIF